MEAKLLPLRVVEEDNELRPEDDKGLRREGAVEELLEVLEGGRGKLGLSLIFLHASKPPKVSINNGKKI
jgi:hypothetical protein